MLKIKGKDMSRKAQMPLALVAVVLLVTGSFFGVVYADIDQKTENSASMAEELVNLDDEVERAGFTIENQIGQVLADVSSAEKGGNLVERSEMFNEKVDDLFSNGYPKFERGISLNVKDRDIHLDLETYAPHSDDSVFTSGGDAAFFTASGTVTLVLMSQSASVEKTVEIDANAASGLPMVLEAATRFELSGEGSMSMLSQMVEYQLSAMAQQRVMQGYGMSEVSDYGVPDILTSEDVAHAFRNAVSVLQTMFFRSNGEGDGELVRACSVDLAKMFAAEDGFLRIDVGSLMSQAILSVIDSTIVKWLDYMGAQEVLDLADNLVDGLGGFFKKLICFVTREDVDVKTIKDHIRNIVGDMGLDTDALLRLESDTIYADVPEYTFGRGVDDDKTQMTIGGGTVQITRPMTDVIEWEGWDGFVDQFEKDRNRFKETLRCIIKDTANAMAGNLTYTIPIDRLGDSTLLDEYRNATDSIIETGIEKARDCSERNIRSNRISDPLLLNVYSKICDNRDAIFNRDGFRSMVFTETMNAARADSPDAYSGMSEVDTLNYMNMVRSTAVEQCMDVFDSAVDRKLADLKVITTASDSRFGSITELLAKISGKLVEMLDLRPAIEKALNGIYEEMSEFSFASPFDGPVKLSGKDMFTLIDDDGRKYYETMSVTDSVVLDAEVETPQDSGMNVHMTRFGENPRASYISYFTVHVDAEVDYTVASSNRIAQIMGTPDACYNGGFDVDLDLVIPCISSWGLAGTQYKESNTIYGDVWNGIIDALAPIIGPMKELFGRIQVTSRVLSSAIMEFSNYLAQTVLEMYENLMQPMTVFWKMSSEMFEGMLNNNGLVGVDLTGRGQTFTFDIMGLTLEIHLNLAAIKKNTKELITVTISKELSGGTAVRVSLKLMKDSDRIYPLVSAGASGSDWGFMVTSDPGQNSGSALLTVSGHTRTVEYSGMMPELVQYRKAEVSLSDIPALDTVLSNIPVPIPGVKGRVDAGISLKYDVPVLPKLVINEVESNPAGDDRDREWAEILNNTGYAVDLEGYRLVPDSKPSKAVTIPGIILAPGARTVIEFPGTYLTNNGDRLTLVDPDGNEVDSTPEFSDNDNSGYSLQRQFDGCTIWDRLPDTKNARNGGPGTISSLAPAVFSLIADSAVEVLDEMGGRVTTVDGFTQYLKNTLTRVIDKVIAMMAGMLVEACLFLSVEFADVTGSGYAGMKISLGVDGDVIEDGVRYLMSMVPFLSEYAKNPQGMTAERVLMQDVYLRSTVYMGMQMPDFLGSLADESKHSVGLSVRTNLSAISQMLGDGTGQWRAEVGLVLEDLPTAIVPPVMDADPQKDSDLWLIRMHFRGIENTEEGDAA